jgi:hypothetical protein
MLYLIIAATVLFTMGVLFGAWLIDSTYDYGEPGADASSSLPSANPMPGTSNTWDGTWWTTDAHYAAEQGEQPDEAERLP